MSFSTKNVIMLTGEIKFEEKFLGIQIPKPQFRKETHIQKITAFFIWTWVQSHPLETHKWPFKSHYYQAPPPKQNEDTHSLNLKQEIAVKPIIP